jgi:hypothetical protein
VLSCPTQFGIVDAGLPSNIVLLAGSASTERQQHMKSASFSASFVSLISNHLRASLKDLLTSSRLVFPPGPLIQ